MFPFGIRSAAADYPERVESYGERSRLGFGDAPTRLGSKEMTGSPRAEDEQEGSDSIVPTVPRPGEEIEGKYLVGSLLGEGGMGLVLSGEHKLLRQGVAIKVLSPKFASDKNFRARFLREARAAASLSSEHAVRIFDVGTTSTKLPFMVMERLEGESLEERLERGTIGASLAVDWILQATRAVAEAHERGLVHRDLKPGNLFLTTRSDGRVFVKVLDFGISKSMDESDGSTSDVSLTAPRALLGSPLYMSPEQLRDSSAVDARTDVWALGVVLFELLSGRAPFESSSVPELYAKILNDPVPRLSTLVPTVSRELEALVHRCLEKDRDARFADAAELGRALAQFAESTGPVSTAATIAADRPSSLPNVPSKSRGRVVLTGGALVIVLVALVLGSSKVFSTQAAESRSPPTPSASETARPSDSSIVNLSPSVTSSPSAPVFPNEDGGPLVVKSADAKVAPPPSSASARAVSSADPNRVRALKQIKLIE